MRPKRSAKPRLGRLEKINPIDYWQSEADFKQWLAEPENLQQLSEALDLDLSRLDDGEPEDPAAELTYLICQDTANQQPVLINLQLAQTDAEHLGQLVTRAATTAVPLVVWVAADLTPAHITALDWLNHLGQGMVYFFGVEVELWQIGKDAMAAKMKCVCQPAAWVDDQDQEDDQDHDDSDAPEVTDLEQSPPAEAPPPLTETQQENLEFWTQLCDRLDRQGSLVKPGAPTPDDEMGFAIARAGFRLSTRLDREAGSLQTRLLLSGEDAHPHFFLLAYEQDHIVNQINLPLIWDDSQEKVCSIATVHTEVDIADQSRWPDYLAWFCDCLDRFHQTFFDRIKRLDATDYQPLPDYGLKAPPNSLILPASQIH